MIRCRWTITPAQKRHHNSPHSFIPPWQCSLPREWLWYYITAETLLWYGIKQHCTGTAAPLWRRHRCHASCKYYRECVPCRIPRPFSLWPTLLFCLWPTFADCLIWECFFLAGIGRAWTPQYTEFVRVLSMAQQAYTPENRVGRVLKVSMLSFKSLRNQTNYIFVHLTVPAATRSIIMGWDL